MYPEHLFDQGLRNGVSQETPVTTPGPSYDDARTGVRCGRRAPVRNDYCVIRVSGPGVYGECADR